MEIQLTKKRLWYFKLFSKPNGKVMMTSEGYFSKWNAKRSAKRLSEETGFPIVEVK